MAGYIRVDAAALELDVRAVAAWVHRAAGVASMVVASVVEE